MVRQMKDQCPGRSLTGLCRLLGFSPQAYYQHHRSEQKKKIKSELVLQQVHLIRRQHPAIGGRKLHYMLQSFFDEHQIQISMSEKGEPLQNPIAERLNGILKYEYLFYHQINNLQEANRLLQTSVDVYNNDRPHLSCGMLTPKKAHLKDIELTKRWKNYYKPEKSLNQF